MKQGRWALFLILVLSLIASQGFASRSLTVFTDKPSYTVGETVFVYGNVTQLVEGERVNITIVAPDGKIWSSLLTLPDKVGNYGAALGTISEMDSTGLYTVIASYRNDSARTYFLVRTAVSIEVKTDKDIYLSYENISVAGRVTPYLPNYPITIYIRDDAGTVKALTQLMPLPNGSFTVQDLYQVRPDEKGIWSLVAAYGNLVSTEVFFFVGLYVNVEVSQSLLRPGDLLNVTGSVSLIISGPVNLTVVSPSGALWAMAQADVDADGKFIFQDFLYPHDESGNYTVHVSYWGAFNDTSFILGRLGVDTFNITDAGVFGECGRRLRVLYPGQVVQIAATLYNNDIVPHEYVYIVEVRDKNGVIVLIEWTTGTLGVGESTRQMVEASFLRPNSFTATILVWDGWETSTPLAEEVRISFEVF